MKFTGTVKDGVLKLHDRQGFKRSLYDFEGEVSLEIKKAVKQRSPKQNSYYRVVIKQVANELGYTEDELHQEVKRKFQIESTKDLEQHEFSDFLDQLIIYFAQLGFPVQDPRGR